jgi:hypothetical protein
MCPLVYCPRVGHDLLCANIFTVVIIDLENGHVLGVVLKSAKTGSTRTIKLLS